MGYFLVVNICFVGILFIYTVKKHKKMVVDRR